MQACALDRDIQHMSQQDLTPVGDRGAALSGGQIARVALARALYQVGDLSWTALDWAIQCGELFACQHSLTILVSTRKRFSCFFWISSYLRTHHFSLMLNHARRKLGMLTTKLRKGQRDAVQTPLSQTLRAATLSVQVPTAHSTWNFNLPYVFNKRSKYLLASVYPGSDPGLTVLGKAFVIFWERLFPKFCPSYPIH